MTCSRSDVFCDWLDVTCSPDSSFLDALVRFLDVGCYPVAFSDDTSRSFRVGDGILRLDSDAKWHRASASGSVLSQFRLSGQLQEYLSLLSLVPHTVTRLDAALDTSEDFPGVLRALRRRYPAGKVFFSRKSLRVTELLAVRDSDGLSTGTWYAGHRAKAKITVRVYDKQNEILDRTGVHSGSRTRYEFTFRKAMGVTLKDASMPASLFYQHSAQVGIAPPAGVEPWASHDLGGWNASPVDPVFTLSQFTRRVETSPELQHIAALARQFGPNGRSVVMRALDLALFGKTSAAEGDDLRGERSEAADRRPQASTGIS